MAEVNINAIFDKVLRLMKSGKKKDVINIYKKLTESNQSSSDIANMFAQISLQNNLVHDGIFWLKKSLEINAHQPNMLLNLGVALFQKKEFSESIKCYKKVIEMDKKNPLIYFNLGLSYLHNNDIEKAFECYKKSISLKPDYVEALNGLGRVSHLQKNYIDALNYFDKAINIKNNYAEIYYNKAITLTKLKRNIQAIENYNYAITYKNDYFEAFYNQANLYLELKQHDKALASYNRAIELNSDYHESYNGKGNLYLELKQLDKALASYNRAIELNSDYHESYNGKGITLLSLKKYDKALQSFKKGIELKPDFNGYIYGDFLHTKAFMCDWDDQNKILEHIKKKLNENKKVSNPFPLLSLIDDPLTHKKASETYISENFPQQDNFGPVEHKKHKKIRIGYFSSDFKDHPISYLTAELFEKHDKSFFEVYTFSFSAEDEENYYQQRIKKGSTYFFNVSMLSDVEVVHLARKNEIDIAIDLNGFTYGSRTNIFSYRVAKVQISFLGYLGSMGSPYYDYLISDEIIIPKDFQKFYTEKILYIQNYQCNDTKRIISNKKFSKEELGLPSGKFIFTSANSSYKITPLIFNSWLKILNSVPNSILWLIEDNEFAKKNLLIKFQNKGIKKDRIFFSKKIPYSDYLARLKIADLSLDTHPYNAGTTASDALWAGVPMVTFLGMSFASRMSASILTSAGLSELIASSKESYENLAIDLASNKEKMNLIKQKLKNITKTDLFNIEKFTKNFEIQLFNTLLDNDE